MFIFVIIVIFVLLSIYVFRFDELEALKNDDCLNFLQNTLISLKMELGFVKSLSFLHHLLYNCSPFTFILNPLYIMFFFQLLSFCVVTNFFLFKNVIINLNLLHDYRRDNLYDYCI